VALHATHDETLWSASNDSCPRLGCRLRRKPPAAVSDGATPKRCERGPIAKSDARSTLLPKK
jgi:hypothetical protein